MYSIVRNNELCQCFPYGGAVDQDPAILLIQDGNRRWARERGVSLEEGYDAMARGIARVCDALATRGISRLYLTVTSVANMQRPIGEIRAAFPAYLSVPEYAATPVKVELRGNLGLLREEFRTGFDQLVADTEGGSFGLYYLVNWSVSDEVARICESLRGSSRPVTVDDVYAAADIKEPIDLIIRTGRCQRLSAFWPLQGDYAELYFSDLLFPDITEADVDAALGRLSDQKRRYGR